MRATNPFYLSKEWRRVRRKTLAGDRGECQDCKARGKYTRANTVHHVNYLEARPDLGLCAEYEDGDGRVKRNLVSLCHDCHERRHGYRARVRAEPLTAERW
jgi:5-methylcytosine-specific restriction endonuclease McrA